MTETGDLMLADALLIVDMQNDFLPGGALPVSGSDSIMPVINAYIAKFQQHGRSIYATRDWHPPDHGSFLGQGGPWPAHCIAGSKGAEFATALRLPEAAPIVSTGTAKELDGYSAFVNTDFQARLERDGIQRLFVCGVATDYCVLQTVLDALRLGFRAIVLVDAIRAVDVEPEDGANALKTMLGKGAQILTLDKLS